MHYFFSLLLENFMLMTNKTSEFSKVNVHYSWFRASGFYQFFSFVTHPITMIR